jgi:very-long-chain (3R)-3-hydroxyacyl-CoA dehydratase
MSARQTTAKAAAPNDQRSSTPSSPAKNAYLLAYNALSAALWASVLYQTITIGSHEVANARKAGVLFGGGKQGVLGDVKRGLSSGKVYGELEAYTRGVQTVAGMEVLHSLFGIVRAPLLTTLMQVASRFLLVWGIAHPDMFAASTKHSSAYATMLVAWSVTEVIRYSYFVFTLSGLGVPKIWTWLRYVFLLSP